MMGRFNLLSDLMCLLQGPQEKLIAWKEPGDKYTRYENNLWEEPVCVDFH